MAISSVFFHYQQVECPKAFPQGSLHIRPHCRRLFASACPYAPPNSAHPRRWQRGCCAPGAPRSVLTFCVKNIGTSSALPCSSSCCDDYYSVGPQTTSARSQTTREILGRRNSVVQTLKRSRDDSHGTHSILAFGISMKPRLNRTLLYRGKANSTSLFPTLPILKPWSRVIEQNV